MVSTSHALRRALAAGVVALGAALLPATLVPAALAPTAAADPVLPVDASQAQQQLAELSHQASDLNEQVLRATDALTEAQGVERAARDRVAAATAALAGAERDQAQFQPTVDALASASYQGARITPLTAVLVSTSPQQLLDQMTGLQALAADTTQQVRSFADASAAATRARDDATAAAAQAATATADAARVAQELTASRDDLGRRTTLVRAQFAALSPGEQSAYAGATTPAGYTAPPGSGVGYAALQAALTRLGAPYSWGATGPDAFDCSGLVQWSYRQAGVSLPRTSQAQGQVGTHVDPADLQPGDIVTFYPGATHVGIYAGDGMIVHASDYGIPVKVAPIGNQPINDARRL
ncbi:peptidoglycan hydrolase RipC [Rhodococcus aerolatus]